MLLAPGDERERDRAVDDADREAGQTRRAKLARAPRASRIVATRKSASRMPATPRRISIIAAGGKSRTATLMKRYDAPQIAASEPIRSDVRAAHERRRYRRRPGYTDPLTQVAEQPLHRALGLTDGEFKRIGGLLGREPNHFELAVFSLLWSEHCGYKHSAPLLKRLPSDRRARSARARRERRSARPR